MLRLFLHLIQLVAIYNILHPSTLCPRYHHNQQQQHVTNVGDVKADTGDCLVFEIVVNTMKLRLEIHIQNFGKAAEAVITKDDDTLLVGAGDESSISMKLKGAHPIRDWHGETSSEDVNEEFQERITRHSCGGDVLKLEGSSEVEVIEKKVVLILNDADVIAPEKFFRTAPTDRLGGSSLETTV